MPLTLAQAISTALDPALALLPLRMDTPVARVQLLATAGQESRWEHRQQLVGKPPMPVGPAKSYYQFEQGGVRGVMRHPASAELLRTLCATRGVRFDVVDIWNAIKHDDVLATGLARLLIWTDALPMPVLGNVDGAFALYLRTWNPGAWKRGTPDERDGLRAKWAGNYSQALKAVS